MPKTRPLIFFAVAFSFLLLLGYLYADAGILSRRRDSGLPRLGAAPSFTLTNQHGESFSTESLHGKIWTLNFFFTSCPDVCPVIVGNVRTLHDAYPKGPEPVSVALSVDPKNDTPEKMREFGDKLGLNHARWQLLRGDIEEIRAISEKQMKTALGPDASMHSNRVFLVDRSGTVRGSYLALQPGEMKKMKSDLLKLAKEDS